MANTRRYPSALLLIALGLGCGDDGGDGGGPGGGTFNLREEAELDSPALCTRGGGGGSGQGGSGGMIEVRAEGPIALGSGSPAPAPQAPPPAPSGGTSLGAADLAQDVTLPGTILISGDVTTSGAGSVRTVTSTGGDIVVRGALRGGALSTGTQGISLIAPNGTVFITGTLSTKNPDAAAGGDAGGPVTVQAFQAVLTGEVRTDGELQADGPGGSAGTLSVTAGTIHFTGGTLSAEGGAGGSRGGAGGHISLSSSGALFAFGSVTTKGGTAQGSADGAEGGRGGDLNLAGVGTADVVTTARIRGGAGRTTAQGARGGAGGTLRFEGRAPLRLYGTVDARGGSTEAGGGTQTGGPGGSLRLGVGQALLSLEVGSPAVRTTGGAGGSSGGNGGAVALYSAGGDIRLAGAIESNGGASDEAPGNGAAISAFCDVGGGSVRSQASISAVGGSATNALINARGGNGGKVDLDAASLTGSIFLEPASSIRLDGGDSSGTGVAGGGGALELTTPESLISIAGTLQARGGSAPGAGGTGGRGGVVFVVSDDNASGVGGDITVEPGALLDVSGGPGAIGGHARHDDGPSASTNPERCSVSFDSDSASQSNMGGIIRNLGSIVATGGAQNGGGGDVTFHGVGEPPLRDPAEGSQNRSGHGSGLPGNFLSD